MGVTTRRRQTSTCLLRPTSSIPDSFLSLGSHDHSDRPLSLHRAQLALFEDICSYLKTRQSNNKETNSDASAAEYILEWSRRTCYRRNPIQKVDTSCNTDLTDLTLYLYKTGSHHLLLQRICPGAQDAVLQKLWKHLECSLEVRIYDIAVEEEAEEAKYKKSLHGKRRRKDNGFKKPSYPRSLSSDFQPRYKSWYNGEDEVDKRDKKRTKQAIRPAPVITETGEIDQVNKLSGSPSPSSDRIEAAELHFWTDEKRYVGTTRATIALLDGIEAEKPGAGQLGGMERSTLIPPGKVFKKAIKPGLAAIVSQRIVDLVERRMAGV